MFKKLKLFAKNNYKYLLFCFVLLVLNAFFVWASKGVIGRKKVLLVSLLLVLQVTIYVVVFYLKEKRQWKIHQIFLLLSGVLGLLYVFVMPIGAAPDEANHFRRAYEVSQGKIISAHEESTGIGGDVLPESINELFSVSPTEIKYKDYSEIATKSSQDSVGVFQEFGNTALYSPIVYAPQATGILLGRIFHLPVVAIFYVSRICNLIAWVVLGYFAIKNIPVGKNVLLLLLFMPMSMQSAASCQADAVTNASTIMILAFVLSKIKTPKMLSRKELIFSALLAVLVAMSKIVYLPLCFLLFLLPEKCFKSKKDKWIKLASVVGLTVIFNLCWLAISSGYLVEFNPGVDSTAQLKYILSNPANYIVTIFNTLVGKGTFFFFSFFGTKLSYFNLDLSEPYIVAFSLFLFYAYLQENRKSLILSVKQKIVMALISATCLALIFTSLYIQWTPLRETFIDGIQGRYFIPLFLPLLLLLNPLSDGNRNKKHQFDIFSCAIVTTISVYTLSTMAIFYLR